MFPDHPNVVHVARIFDAADFMRGQIPFGVIELIEARASQSSPVFPISPAEYALMSACSNFFKRSPEHLRRKKTGLSATAPERSGPPRKSALRA